MISFEQALSIVNAKLAAARLSLMAETVPLAESLGRVLAKDVAADRDYPPFHRSIRDGFAVRSADVSRVPTLLRLRGEVRAGQPFEGAAAAGECVSIMTGAPLPAGCDAVVMVEHTEAHSGEIQVRRTVSAGENVVRQGSEAATGARILEKGKRLGAGELGLLAAVGKSQVTVFARPAVAILATGDEIVPVEQRPEWFQVRNSNTLVLAAQVAAAGGIPRLLGVAPDRPEALRTLIQEGLSADLLVLSGGISVGKYDFAAQVLADLGADFFFQGVALRPGKPLAFGRASGRFFFALPGNPISTLVTFALFVRPALAVLGGASFSPPVFLRARLASPKVQTGDLTVFLPARLDHRGGDAVVSTVGWQGSGDLVALAAANCFLVVHPGQAQLTDGDWAEVMLKDPW